MNTLNNIIIREVIILKTMKKILGVVMIILGISGVILPLLPGWMFILAGFGMLLPQNKSQCTY